MFNSTNRIHSTNSRIILAGASVRSLAESAIRGGYHPLCVDFFGDADLRESLKPLDSTGQPCGTFLGTIAAFDELPLILERVNPAIPLVWAGGLENCPDVLDLMADRRPVSGTSAAACRRIRDPFLLSDLVRSADGRFPATFRTNEFTRETVVPDTRRGPDTQWLVKRLASSGGCGVSRFDAASRAGSIPPDAVIQQFVDGIPLSAVFCSTAVSCSVAVSRSTVEEGRRSTRLLGCSIQLVGLRSLGASGFQFCGNVGPVRLACEIMDRLRTLGEIIARQGELSGVFGIDFVLATRNNEPEIFVIEVNPRLTASHELFEHAGQPSFVRLHVEACEGALPAPRSPKDRCLIRAILYSGENFVTEKVSIGNIAATGRDLRSDDSPFVGLTEFLPEPAQESVFWLADIPAPGTPVRRGQPLCSLYAAANSLTSIAEPIQFIGRKIDDGIEFGGGSSILRGTNGREFETDLHSLYQSIQPFLDLAG